MIKLDFHLINLSNTIDGVTYEYKSKGGRVMALGLLAGFIAKYYGYLDWSNFGIIAASIGACLAWDIITAGIYIVRMAKKQAIETMVEEIFEKGREELISLIQQDAIFYTIKINSPKYEKMLSMLMKLEGDNYLAIFNKPEKAQKFLDNNKEHFEKMFGPETKYDIEWTTISDIYRNLKTDGSPAGIIYDGENRSDGMRTDELGTIIPKGAQTALEIEKAAQDDVFRVDDISNVELLAKLKTFYVINAKIKKEEGVHCFILSTLSKLSKTEAPNAPVMAFRVEEFASGMWNIYKKKFAESGQEWEEPDYILTTNAEVLNFVESVGADGVYFYNSAKDVRHITVEEIRAAVQLETSANETVEG